jgi:hypothetical protein
MRLSVCLSSIYFCLPINVVRSKVVNDNLRDGWSRVLVSQGEHSLGVSFMFDMNMGFGSNQEQVINIRSVFNHNTI